MMVILIQFVLFLRLFLVKSTSLVYLFPSLKATLKSLNFFLSVFVFLFLADAYVPIIKFRFSGVQIDMLFCRFPGLPAD